MTNKVNDKALYKDYIWEEKLHWISGKTPEYPLKAAAKIRYMKKPFRVEVAGEKSGKVEIIFKTSQRAVMPGQSVVLYRREKVLGGGIIIDK